ncbi:peroxisome proliferator-activated receptor gamma coactivator-related protein 1 [Pseudonaja textilis]|uniref:PPARG related coactivator 1 n=1 Tax=Pseudonaja textilis TaxID=8673 RepID=A0A670ZVA3_PSETE|nr:peroxisome proliferator-activated receptor gamma coactivator-related protein 1 [Pseudonaja textilis]
MAALWGGGAGHAGAGGTLPMRGASEPLVGNIFSSTQCLLAEDLHLASLEAETILEAGEFLETMQDYLDSSVISITEDFSSLTEVKSHMDAENELSLLTTITDILDSTDDETLSPFDPIPESELLTSEIENSLFQRFLSFSVTPDGQGLHNIEDFQEPGLYTIMSKKVEASTTRIPFSLSSSCAKLSAFSNNASNKALGGKQKLFKNREQESPVLQSSDGEEEEEEVARGCRESLTAAVKEMEPEGDLDECDDPYIIAAENISLDELVRSVHSYCQPTLSVCLSSDNQSLAEKNLTGPLVLETMPDGGELLETKLSPTVDSSYITGLTDIEVELLSPALGKELPEYRMRYVGPDRELDSYEQDGKVVTAALPNIKDNHPQIEEDTQKSIGNQKNISEPVSVAPQNAKLFASKKGQVSTNMKKKKKKKSRAETKYHKTINCQLVSACPPMQTRIDARKSLSDSSFQKKEPERTGGKELLLNQVSQTKETHEAEVEWSKCVREEGSKNPLLSNLVSAKDLPYAEEPTQNLGNSDPAPIVPGKPHEKSQSPLPVIEKSSSEASQMLPDCTRDLTEQLTKDTSCSENKEAICPPREAKPRPLSLSEYRQRRQRQRQSNNDSIQNTRENRSASKWPSVPKLPTELADLPCLKAPLPSAKAAAPKLVKEPEKPADSTTLAPDDKASAMALSMPSSSTTLKQRDPPSSQLLSSSPVPAVPASKVCAFSHIGPQVPPTLSIPHVPPAPESFLPAPPNHYSMGSSQPAGSSWSPFPLLPANYQSLPPPPPATEACSPVFHTVPPSLPPTWPPPLPVPLPFVPALSYGSVEWAPPPQSSYWSGISVPPPVLPVPYGDQGGLRQSPPVGTLHVSSLSDVFPGQQSTALTPESSCIGFQNVVGESQSLPVQVCQVEAPLAIKATPRKISDPRRQTQLSTVQSQTEVTSSSSQSLEKLPLSPLADKPSKKPALTRRGSKGSTLQSLGGSLPVPPSHQILGEHAGKVKFSKDFQLVEKNPELSDSGETTDTVAQNNKKPLAEEHSLSGSLAPGKQQEPAEIQPDVTEYALVDPSPSTLSGLQKGQENGHLSKKASSSMWKNQPFISSAQHKHDKDLVHSFINEIGIEASDLSSLLEQFEKIEAKTEVSGALKKNKYTGNNGSDIQWEKKMVDRLHAPELINVAGLTPPATPPHQLWKPLVPASLLGQDGSPKDTQLLKSLNKPHWKAVIPVHVGAGEHDYCQLTVAQPKGGAKWNVKQNLDITIKPIKTLTRQVLDQTSADIKRPPATVRLNPVVPTCQNPREIANHINSNKGQTKDSRTVTADLKPTILNSTLLETSLIHPCKEALDHRTTIPGSMTRSNDDPCSVLLSPAASPCQDSGESTLQQLQEIQQKPLASKRSLRCYRSRQRSVSPKSQRGRSRRNHASRSFSSSSDGDSDTSASSLSSSSSSSQSRSRSPPSKHWRRCRSRNSSSSPTKWSHSRGRSRSPSNSSYRSRSSFRSPSPHRRNSCRKSYNSSSSYEHYQRQKNKYKERAIEERRVVFIGKIHNRMTRSELRHRFSVFGDIEDCTLHFREHRDNFGFVTYRYAEDAFAAIEGGHALVRPDEQPFDLGFGGRRQFCKRSYVDLDSTQDDFQPAHLKNKYDALDFDTLLKQAQRSLRR